MRRTRFALGFVVGCLVGSPMSAGAEGYRAAPDPRIRAILYDPDQVVRIDGYYGYQLTVEFGKDEHIENVSIGDSTAWQITPNHKADLLFVKPVDRGAPTNMTVVTDERRYVFQLISRGAPKHAFDIPYVIRFVYPPQPPGLASFSAATALSDALPAPEHRNSNYSYTGSRAALPSLVFDDGHFTFFQWPENAATPAVFVVLPDGSESIVNFGVRGGYQIVEQTASRFVLRNGKEVTTVINNAWREPSPGALAPRPADAKTAKAAIAAGNRQ